MIRRNATFLALLTLGVALRVVTMLGFRGAIHTNDGYDYIAHAVEPYPFAIRPVGYSFFLWLLKPLHSFTAVAIVQHLMGLTIAVLVYAVLRRYGCRAWLAAVATVPVLLDGYRIGLEHTIMSDSLFGFLIAVAVVIVMWPADGRPRWWAGVPAGLLIGMAGVIRPVGLPLIALLIAGLVIKRCGWRVVAGSAVAFVVPVAAYMTWFHSAHDRYALTNSEGLFLYARVMSFADCARMRPPPSEAVLCTSRPSDQRESVEFYAWNEGSPVRRLPGELYDPERQALAVSFAKRAIASQPLDYARTVAIDVGQSFVWDLNDNPNRPGVSRYVLVKRDQIDHLNPWWNRLIREYDQGPGSMRVVDPFASFMRAYQGIGHLPGLGLLAIVLIGAYRFWQSGLIPWTLGLALLVLPPATHFFDYRYTLPAVPLLCLAAALSITALLTRTRKAT